jgi:hypothetical protein
VQPFADVALVRGGALCKLHGGRRTARCQRCEQAELVAQRDEDRRHRGGDVTDDASGKRLDLFLLDRRC